MPKNQAQGGEVDAELMAKNIQKLIELGFGKKKSERALKSTRGNFEAALKLLQLQAG